ncbi:serine hydrolase domain-containing protein [Thalassotalea sp. ND16A]|uniref:serine hydrolase domain-containing protein n=1 Tax=Thalassotalea sp. ND16A TaxID=1535422 RepID=UPI00051A41F7|nr:serine hydrolase [Thalassotalea sp. ND16A]KGJ92451.1 hypothetical protein ND16A_1629 [Thalassotalea sp. ND16A]
MPELHQQAKRLLSVFMICCIASCGGSGSDSNNKVFTPYQYQAPEQTNDGWQSADLAELNIQPDLLTTLVDNINSDTNGFRHIDSVLIVKDNKLVFEQQFKRELDFSDDWANNKDIDLHILNSVTKSFNSALIGIAIEQGYIASPEVKVLDYFQHKNFNANWDVRKADVTLKNWLTMRHGLQWDEWNVSYLLPENLNSQMNNAADPIQFLLDRPMATEPGETFAYSTGISFGIGRLLQHATGQSVSHFMQHNLFDPLNIANYDYWSLDGQLHTGSALYLSSRDMAKLGQLYLDKGKWQGQQVISSAWVEESTVRHVDNGSWGYGYQWWMTTFTVNGEQLDTFYADGFGGQFIFVFPSINAVIVFTGDAYEPEQKEQRNVSQILEQYILPALL